MRKVLIFGILVSSMLFQSLNVLAQEEITSFEVRWSRLRRVLSAYIQVAQTPGPISQEVLDSIMNANAELFNQEVPLRQDIRRVRTIVASLFKNPESRAILISLMNQELTRLSNELKKATFTNETITEPRVIKVSELVVGMGPQTAAYLQEKANIAPNESILVVDSAKKAGGAFADLGAAFYLNSTNRQNNGQRAQPGEGDLNYLHDIVGLPDFLGRRWVEAGFKGQVAQVGVFLSQAVPLLETTVESIREIIVNNRFGYEGALRDANGNSVLVQAERVVFITGLGQAKPFGNPATEELIEMETRSAERAQLPPPIETFKDFTVRVANAQNSQNFSDITGKTILLVGAGDSGRTIAEFLTGLGPEGAYRNYPAQVGRPRRIYWFTGIEGIASCEKFVATSRARYAAIAQAINSGVLVPVPGKVDAIESVNGGSFPKYAVTGDQSLITSSDGTIVGTRKIEIVQTPFGPKGSRVQYIVPDDQRKNRQAEIIIETVAFDKVILANGFESQLPKVLAPIVGGSSFAVSFFPISRKVESFGRDINIGRRTRARDSITSGIYLVGPANEVISGLPDATETVGISANTVSSFANTERTKEMARFVQELVNVDPASKLDLETENAVYNDFLSQQRQSRVQNVDIIDGNGMAIDVESVEVESPKSFPNVERVNNAELALRVALDLSLRNLRFKGSFRELTLEIQKTQNGYRLEIRFANFNEQDRETIRESFRGNELLNSVLLRDVFSGRQNYNVVDVTVPIRENGRLDLRKLQTRLGRRGGR